MKRVKVNYWRKTFNDIYAPLHLRAAQYRNVLLIQGNDLIVAIWIFEMISNINRLGMRTNLFINEF